MAGQISGTRHLAAGQSRTGAGAARPSAIPAVQAKLIAGCTDSDGPRQQKRGVFHLNGHTAIHLSVLSSWL